MHLQNGGTLKDDIVVYVDNDWAGCKTTRKSTSSGYVFWGPCLLTNFSRTQSVIAQSSGEAELYAIASGAAEGLLAQTILTELGLGVTVRVRIKSDSTAGIAIASRLGLGKLKHVDIKYMHVQQLVHASRVRLGKVPGANNCADLGTKFFEHARLYELKKMICVW